MSCGACRACHCVAHCVAIASALARRNRKDFWCPIPWADVHRRQVLRRCYHPSQWRMEWYQVIGNLDCDERNVP